ncbi:MAG: 16S rRNA (cytosine(1402)-N(4))-methyltransferase RsmH [Proteobacteria bacterium]|nr:16S rRNA (cytosine(1402)-N(4))-methyltransferase RsmH [Pseudomonadota bacterium]MBU1610803.1 16S rRNA (cytosine(1402)-N(4))-methyltransferase RsmH [Pseudomonadota bacterium]
MDETQSGLHQTVLLHEVVDWLAPKPGGRYMDGTTGMGGHSEGILKACGEAHILCLDRDAKALGLARERLEPWSGRTRFEHLAFSCFERALEDAGWDGIDGAVLDLGVSSMQLDTPDRGFSFMESGPLDMRMDPASGLPPASRLVNKGSFSDLKRILAKYGEEPMAGRIVRAILREREHGEITDTARLAQIVCEAYPAKWRANSRTHPATRTFQALRIEVNRELEELETFMDRIAGYMNPGGRIAIISFHSLEDRVVKRAFQAEAKGCDCPRTQPVCVCGKVARLRLLTRKPQLPTEEEMYNNPRSRSAKLRVAERLETGGSNER